MFKNFLPKKPEPQKKTPDTTKQDEYIQYSQDIEKTLRILEQHLHTSDDPKEIAISTLKTVCDFYQGDWAGILEVDLDLNLWTPFWWYNTDPNDVTLELIEEYESSEYLHRWTTAMHENRALIVHDAETVKGKYPEEYSVYQRLGVKSLIAVPIKPRPTAFLVVRNPKRYQNRSSMLSMLAFVVLTAVNERKLFDSVKMTLSPEDIQSDNDVIINLFGELEIYTAQGVLRESEMKSPKIASLITYLVLHPKTTLSPISLAEHIWNETEADSENAAKNIRGLIYRFRQMFALISKYQLIESVPNGYRLNPQLNIMTDIQKFDDYREAVGKTSSVINKVELLKQAISLYKGNVLMSAAGEHWITGISSRYYINYTGVVNELLKTLALSNDYYDVTQYASESLEIEPGNMKAYYWLIVAMYKQGATEMAYSELKVAKHNLIPEEYEELVNRLKKHEVEVFDENALPELP